MKRAIVKLEVVTDDPVKLKEAIECGRINLPSRNLIYGLDILGKIQKVTCEEEIPLSGNNS